MPGLSLGLRLSRIAKAAAAYVKENRVLDLFSSFSSSSTTVIDKSGEGNNATMYSGRFVTTDGVADKAINADCSALGAGTYKLTGKVKPTGTTAELTMDGSTDSGLTGLTAAAWQDFDTGAASVTPSAVTLGWDGTTFSAADWSDVRLIDTSTGSTVARWQLNESAAADLDGYPALDSVSGYHGTHTGCAGGTGETTILQTAGMDWNKFMQFDGLDDYLSNVSFTTPVGDWFVEAQIYLTSSSNQFFLRSNTNGFQISVEGSTIRTDLVGVGSSTISTSVTPYLNKVTKVRLEISGTTRSFFVDDVLIGTNSTGTPAASLTTIGATNIGTVPLIGGFFVSLNLNDEQTWDGTTENATAQSWTINGSPSNILVTESDTTSGQDAVGVTIVSPRPTNYTFNFFGDGEYAEIADADELDVAGDISIEMWLNPYEDNIGGEIYISKDSNSGAGTRSWSVGNVSVGAGEMCIDFYTGGVVRTYTLSGLLDRLSQIVVTRSATTGEVKVFENTVPYIATGTKVVAAIDSSTAPVRIGAQGDGTNFSEKQESAIKIYSSLLSAADVLTNFNAECAAYGLDTIPLTYDPTTDAELYAWYDPSDGTTLTESLGLVSAMADKSSNGQNLTQSTDLNKLSTGTRTIGGLNALEGDGAGRYLSNGGWMPPTTFMLLVVAEWDIVNDIRDSVCAYQASGADFQLDASDASNFIAQFNPVATGGSNVDTGVINNGPAVYSIVCDQVAGVAYVRCNGDQSINSIFTTPLEAVGTFIYGANRSTAFSIDGAIGEMIVSEDIKKITQAEAYLANKWGITL